MTSIPDGYKQISVASYGAIPNDGTDDTEAVGKAIQECVRRPGSVLIFPRGQYDFSSAKRLDKRIYQMQFRHARQVVIDGKGSRLVFAGKTAPFLFENCQDVTLINLTIDWDHPLYTTGIITDASPRRFDVALDSEYTGQGSERIESVIEFDARTRLPLAGGRDIHDLPGARKPIIQRFEKIAPKTLRVHLSRRLEMTKGAYAVLRHQVYVYNAFTVRDCQRVTLQDVSIHYAPGMGFSCKRTQDVLLKRVTFAPPPGSGRVLSISSDATHFTGCTGTIRIEDCTFRAMGDDATNIHGLYLDVVALVDDHTLQAKCKQTWIFPPGVGHIMEFTHPVSLLPFATGRVQHVTVDQKARIHRIAFDKPLDKAVRVGCLLANATRTAKARISGNTVIGNRARGFVIKTRDAIVANNRLEFISGAGIFVAVEGNHWRESIGTRDVTIRNNLIKGCNGGPSRRWAAISVFAFNKHRRQGEAGVHQNLLIQKNKIVDTDNAGIFIAAADGVRIEDNTITNCSRDPSRPGGENAIYLTNCRNVTIRNNSLKDPGCGFRKAVETGPRVETDTLKLEGNAGF